MSQNYELAVIDNAGPNTLRTALRKRLSAASEVRVQVAFATTAGVSSVLSSLQRAAGLGSVRFMTGLYQCITEPGALRLLIQAAEASGGRFQVCLSKELQLHTKMYLIATRTRATCIIGSSNLSRDGLLSSGELNLSLTSTRSAPIVRTLIRKFDEAWELDSVKLTRDRILRYEKHRPQFKIRSLSRTELRAILGSTANTSIRPEKTDESEPPILWREAIEGFAANQTRAIVRDETNWDRRRFDWHSYPPERVRRGHRLLIFDFTKKVPTLQLAQVRDTTHTSVPTPDGRDFVAYTPVARSRKRRLTSSLWSKIIDLDIVRSRKHARSARRMNSQKLEQIVGVLRKA